MPMTLTEYWGALERDVSGLKRELGRSFDYTNYAPVAAVERMIIEGKRIETTLWPPTLNAIKENIQAQEALIGDLPDDTDIPQTEKLRRPRLNNDQDFFFAIIYYAHQTRFADVESSNILAGPVIQQFEKPKVALNAPGLLRAINQYYEQHRDELIAQFPTLTTAADETILDKVDALIHPRRPFDSLMADAIQREFTAIIEAGPDASSIVTNLRAHFEEKEQIITRMHTAKCLQDQLDQEDMRLANLDEPLFTAFLDLLTPDDRTRIQDARTALAPVNQEATTGQQTVVLAPQTLTYRQTAGDWIRWGWSLGTWLTEETGKRLEPWAPAILTNMVHAVYETSTYYTETASSFIANQLGALPPPPEPLESVIKRELGTLARTVYDNAAGQLITEDSGLTLEDAHRASPADLLQLKEKLHVLNTVLVLDKQMEDFIHTHNKGLVKFIDFFRPINQFLSRTFFRPILHDKALLLEEARQLKKSLGEMKQELERVQDPTTIKDRLRTRTTNANTSIASVTRYSRYVFLHPQLKEDAQAAANNLQDRINQTTAAINAPAA